MFQHVFAQDNLGASVTNFSCSAVCMLLIVPGVGVTFYISEYGEVRAL